MTQHLASQGFIVIAADHPGNDIAARLAGEANYAEIYALRPADVIRQIDFAADVLNAEDGIFEGLIDIEQVGVIGHSFGGWTVLSVAGARPDPDRLAAYCDDNPDDGVCETQELVSEMATIRGYDAIPESPWEAVSDPRIDAVVALAPWNAPFMELSEVTADTLIIVGGADATTIPERDAFVIYDRLQSPRQMMTLELADHYIFVDSCSPLFETFNLQYACTDPVWDMARAHDLINHATTAFFRATLQNDNDAAGALAPDMMNFSGVSYQQD